MFIIGQMKLLASSDSVLWAYECATYLWLLLICWKVPLYCIFRIEDFPQPMLSCMGLWGSYEIVNSSVLLNSTFLSCCGADVPSTQQLCKNRFLPWMGWGSFEQAPWSATSCIRRCEAHYWSRAEKSVTVVLYNYRRSQKMPWAEHNLLFVMLDCLSSVSGHCVLLSCSHTMFIYTVCS